jgi:hypothetical protein
LQPESSIHDDPATRAAFTDAIAEVPVDADPDFTMTETDDLLLRRSVAEGRHLPYR